MDNFLQALNAALEWLWRALEGALENLEQLRRYLARKLDQILQFLERLRILLLKLIQIFFRYALIAAPPIIGLVIAVGIRSISLFVMVLLLSALIAYAFFARQIHGDFSSEKFAKSALEVAPATRIFAITIAGGAIVVTYLINIGVFLGTLLFIAEFFVVFFLRQEISREISTQ